MIKKKILLVCLLMAFVLLAGCHTTQHQNQAHDLQFSLPDDMTVLEPGQTVDANLLATYGLTEQTLSETFANGCLYYAVGTKDGVQRRTTISVQESDYTKEIWHLQKNDPTTAEGFTDNIIEFFNTSGKQLNAAGSGGYHVINKGAFEQGNLYCVFVDLAPYGSSDFDSIYMATVHNGKWYSILYSTNQPITEKTEDEAHDIFSTFHVTKTLSADQSESTNNTGVKAFLFVLCVAIAVAIGILIFRIFAPARPKAEEEAYVSQFSEVTELNQTKPKKDKKS